MPVGMERTHLCYPLIYLPLQSCSGAGLLLDYRFVKILITWDLLLFFFFNFFCLEFYWYNLLCNLFSVLSSHSSFLRDQMLLGVDHSFDYIYEMFFRSAFLLKEILIKIKRRGEEYRKKNVEEERNEMNIYIPILSDGELYLAIWNEEWKVLFLQTHIHTLVNLNVCW